MGFLLELESPEFKFSHGHGSLLVMLGQSFFLKAAQITGLLLDGKNEDFQVSHTELLMDRWAINLTKKYLV